MNQIDFLVALEQELQLRGITFGRADLLAFVASAWPLLVSSRHWPEINRVIHVPPAEP